MHVLEADEGDIIRVESRGGGNDLRHSSVCEFGVATRSGGIFGEGGLAWE